MYLNLIVKGNRFVAAKAAAQRGIPFVFVRETSKGETVGKTGEQHLDKVRAWYAEQPVGNAPYPIGDLLAWSEIDRV